jgi:hypothetical protein
MSELVDLDQEHLRLLRIGFFIMAAMTGAMSTFSIIYVGLGGFFASHILTIGNGSRADTRIVGWIFLVVGGVFLLLGVTATLLTFFTARNIGERRHWTFCVVVAALCCFQFPVGTALGVCALMVLTRPSVKALFASHAVPPPLPF